MSDTNDPESNSDGPDDDANTVPVADQEKHDRLAKEQNILIAGQYLSYGRSTTLSPFEVQTTPLSSINQNCVMYNNHTTRLTTVEEQAKVVSKTLPSIKVMQQVSVSNIAQWQNEAKALLHVHDTEQMDLILDKSFTTHSLHMLQNMCGQLPLQGNFWLSAKLPEETKTQLHKLYLDLHSLSVYRLSELLQLISQALTRESIATTTQNDPPVVQAQKHAKTFIEEVLKLDLSLFLTTAVSAEIKTKAEIWYDLKENPHLHQYMSIEQNDIDLGQHAWTLMQQKAQHRNPGVKERGQQLVNLMRAHTIDVPLSYTTFVRKVIDMFQRYAEYWGFVAQLAEPERQFLFTVPHDKLRAAYDAVKKIINSPRPNHKSGSDTRPGLGATPKSTRSSQDNESSKATVPKKEMGPDCPHCGGKHKLTPKNPQGECHFKRANHPHHNPDKTVPWTESQFYSRYQASPWTSKDNTSPQTRLQFGKLLNDAGVYDEFPMGQGKRLNAEKGKAVTFNKKPRQK